MLREERGVSGLDMSVNLRRSEGDLAKRRLWLVERVWLRIGIRSWFWIRVLSWETVMFGLSMETRSSPSLLRIRTITILLVLRVLIRILIVSQKKENRVLCFASQCNCVRTERAEGLLSYFFFICDACWTGKTVKRTNRNSSFL